MITFYIEIILERSQNVFDNNLKLNLNIGRIKTHRGLSIPKFQVIRSRALVYLEVEAQYNNANFSAYLSREIPFPTAPFTHTLLLSVNGSYQIATLEPYIILEQNKKTLNIKRHIFYKNDRMIAKNKK